MKKQFILNSIFVMLFFLTGCSSKSSNPGPDVSEIINSGWAKFEQTSPDYVGALADFIEAIELNPDVAEAYVGKGWSYAKMGEGSSDTRYALAIDNFNLAINLDEEEYDAHAGMAFAYHVTNKYSKVIEYTDNVLDNTEYYIFSHDQDINRDDLLLIKGQAYFYLGDYDNVIEILKIISPEITYSSDRPEELLTRLQELFAA